MIAALVSVLVFGTTPQAAPVAPVGGQTVRIVLVGDSTTANISGWGAAFCADHVAPSVACVNRARGGRSSGSYIAEGLWDGVLAELSTPGFRRTYVLIQFGHNDQPGKPGRSTDLATQFPANLTRYVIEARAQGAIPVLVTPLARRQFVHGRLQNDLAPWAEAVRRVARDTGAPVVDLNASSAAAIQALGPLESARFAAAAPSPEQAAALSSDMAAEQAPGAQATPRSTPSRNAAVAEPQGAPRVAFDHTHLGREGAKFFSALVAADLIRAVPDLRDDLAP
ncbi:rhamnogalacturonan acetylesterase [Brevundimonas sp. SORGH_AS_0993]|uniref:rhamnogalacturonan acetylesterase n=1 Tax=Brevundimonas sp. SORGH_AS_0993 TaxID=3041794 RepID=UPI0027841837|nr:rhamnogalacturonan acetylesterase [Brevundimonas sp. SORGH_AS_0993]MDQ1154627.1 lysophospholipase L1-like esterase [Brevundimonas sp. SORGH_AS_0993]